MRFDNILLLSDLDGTFLNDEVKPVKSNIDAVNRFAQNGGLFSVASGRPLFRAIISAEISRMR